LDQHIMIALLAYYYSIKCIKLELRSILLLKEKAGRSLNINIY
jgi:hypothetical protein